MGGVQGFPSGKTKLMSTTLTRNLKLRINSNLTADSKYNLERIDLLGSTFLVDSSDVLNVRSLTDISIQPESADLGGSGSGGVVSVGSSSHEIDELNVYASEVNFSDPVGILDSASGGTKYLRIKYKSDASGSVDTAADRILNIDLDGANRTVIFDSDFSSSEIDNDNIAEDAEIEYSKLLLTNSIVNADINSSAAIAYSKLNLSSSIVNADISGSAAIAYSKLNLATSIVNSDISASAAVAYSKLNLSSSIINADISASAAIAGSKIAPQFGDQAITGNSIGLTNGSFSLTLTPSESQIANISLILPVSAPSTGQVLRTKTDDATALEWATAGAGTVSSVGLSMPAEFSVSSSPVTGSGTIAVSKATQSANQIFAGPTTGVAAQPAFRGLVVADIPSGVDHGGLAGLSDDDHTQYHTDARAATWLGTKSTSDLNEGSNLYFTTERAQDSVGAALTDTSSVDLNYDDSGNSITATVLPAGVDHNSLQNYDANKHIDHTGVTISGASNGGLSGGGTIAASRTLSIAPSNATSATPVAADIILFGDVSDSDSLKRTTVQTILDLGGGKTTAAWVTGDGTSKVVTHNFGVTTVSVTVFDIDSGEDILVDSIVRTDSNTVTLTSSQAPAGSGWTVIVRK